MTVTITWQMFTWAFGVIIAWSAFLIAIIRWLLGRLITDKVKSFEDRITATEKKAGDASSGLTAHTQTVATSLASHKQEFSDSLAQYKEALNGAVAQLRLEFSQRVVCGNHDRMEGNDKDLFKRLDNLHGDIRELVGGVKGLTNSLELINQHLLNGGK